MPDCVYKMGNLRIVDLTKVLDPKTESRRCHLIRYNTGGPIPDFHTALDLHDLQFGGSFPVQEPVSAEGTVRNTAGVLVLEAVISTNLHAVCDRCAAPFERRVSWPVHAVLTRSLEREDEADEWTFLLQEGDMADLDEILTTAFVLNMDSKLLCRPDCKGICPRCGKNLNEGACSCRPEIDPRLAVLGQLLKDK